ncbi:restriction endonuclease subunit S [Stutzerimonas nitrititolerans]|uniref:restriction endonuclease subunit S n=1 Tax=Stutzerimonas nitrititolerans TaxID=2482751 RepID=UPI0028A0B72B|nr:restriction endonuclease subunit S [Stutzerimonas nitrititolerans]
MKSYPFPEVITDITAKFTKIKASDYQEHGQYKIIDQGKEAVAGYTDDASLVNGQLLPVVVFGDHTRVLKYVDEPIALGADGAKALWANPHLAHARYVYYYLRSIQIKEAGYSRHFKFLKEVEIPIPFKGDAPDFDGQIRIAHLLGKVEGLIAERKQHLQQLDDLLKSVFLEMFGDPVRNEKGWTPAPLEQLGSINRGVSKHRPRNDPKLLGGPHPLIQTGEVSSAGTYITTYTQTYSDLGFSQSKRWPAGTLCITIAANIAQTGILTFDACFPDSVVGFLAHEGESNTLYVLGLFWFFQAILEKNAPAAAQKNINLVILRALSVPKPPIKLQNEFATVVEKIEALKSRYQKSLADLEALYGALSQQAFKEGLDLSRVVLPAAPIEGEDPVAATVPAPITAPVIELPETDLLLPALQDRTQLAPLLRFWLEAYRTQLGSEAFSLERFIAAAQTRLAELHPDDDFALGASDYDAIKAWVFDALAAGTLAQAFDDDGNRIELKVVQA